MGNPWSCQVKKQSRMPRPTPSDRSGSVPKFEAHLYKSYGLMQPDPIWVWESQASCNAEGTISRYNLQFINDFVLFRHFYLSEICTSPMVRENSGSFYFNNNFKKEDIMPQTFKPRSCHDCLFSEGICDEMPVGADPDTFRCNHYEWKYA